MAEDKVKKEEKSSKPIKISLGKFTKIIIVILVLTITAYFVIDAIEYSANQKNQITDTSNIIENTIGEIESEVSGDIKPEV